MIFEAATEWNCPETFPDLKDAKYIAIDLETKDLDLKSRGSGAIQGRGEIVGIAVAVDGWSGYYPIAHEGGGNLDKRIVLEWFKKVCATDAIKIFHNAMYDVCWIKSYGIQLNGHIIDTMVMASLIDENRIWYSLNSVSFDYLGEVKDEKALKEAADSWGIDAKKEMYKLPAMYVGNYAEKDAELTLELFKTLSREIKKQNLTNIFDLETQLFPCLIDMKFKGVRVDVQKAHELKKKIKHRRRKLNPRNKKRNRHRNSNMGSKKHCRSISKLSLPYETTEKTGAPSFTKNFLSKHANH
jgi:DNA polymerase I-like protein with 3'-5' exonuclease and polymerase domains